MSETAWRAEMVDVDLWFAPNNYDYGASRTWSVILSCGYEKSGDTACQIIARAVEAVVKSRDETIATLQEQINLLNAARYEAIEAAVAKERARVEDKLHVLFKNSYADALAKQLGIRAIGRIPLPAAPEEPR